MKVGRTVAYTTTGFAWADQWYWMCGERCPAGWGGNYGHVSTWQDAMDAALAHLRGWHS